MQEQHTTLRHKVRDAAEKAGERMAGGIARVGEAIDEATDGVREVLEQRLAPRTVIDFTPDASPKAPSLFGATDRGLVRKRNEDHYLIAELDRSMSVSHSSATPAAATRLAGRAQGWTLMVADGLGGHAAGEMASEVAIQTMANYAFTLMPWTFAPPGADAPALAQAFREAVRACERNVRHNARTHAIAGSPGTTLTVAYIAWPNLYIAHVGDSRCYLFRDGRLYRMTRDHTYAQEAATNLPQSKASLGHVLVNAVGGDSGEAKAELQHAALQREDIVFLCTDGVTQYLTDDDLAAELGKLSTDYGAGGAESLVTRVLALANQRGGEDNMTAVVGKF